MKSHASEYNPTRDASMLASTNNIKGTQNIQMHTGGTIPMNIVQGGFGQQQDKMTPEFDQTMRSQFENSQAPSVSKPTKATFNVVLSVDGEKLKINGAPLLLVEEDEV